MGSLQIAFIVVNLIVPYWIWKATSSTSGLAIEWSKWEDSLSRVLDASGGFTCSTSDLVWSIRHLCERSNEARTDAKSVKFDQAIGEMKFACEVRATSVVVSVQRIREPSEDSECGPLDSHNVLMLNPAFQFTHSGLLASTAFDGTNAKRQQMPIRNCRKKAKVAAGQRISSLNDFVRLPGDPIDLQVGHKMCMIFDPVWKPWLQRFAPPPATK